METPEDFVGKKGICNIQLLPLRVDPSDASELNAHLAFGDFFEVLEVSGACIKILREFGSSLGDDLIPVTGWIDTHLMPAMLISTDEYERVKNSPFAYIASRIVVARSEDEGAVNLALPLGSVLREFQERDGEYHFRMQGMSYVIDNTDALIFADGREPRLNDLLRVLGEFEGGYYLWGGQSPQGSDCSGFVQTVMRVFGCELPRNSHQQYLFTERIPFHQVRDGDLMFIGLKSGERVNHVGFMLQDRSGRRGIFHAKQSVKLQWLEEVGEGECPLMYPESAHFANVKGFASPIRFT